MKITQIREKDGVEVLSVLDFNLLIEKIKTEIKTRPVTGLRQALHFVLPGESCSFAGNFQSNTRCCFRTCEWREADESI